jgi:putative membrane protein
MLWVLIAYAICTAIIVYIELHVEHLRIFKDTLQIHSLMGFVIGLLLVFRTNSAYDRWWEGRKQWGAMVNNTRNFAIKIDAAFPDKLSAERRLYQLMIPNYVMAMKEHLREGTDMELLEIENNLDRKYIEKYDHKPNAISQLMYKNLHDIYRQKHISGDQLITLDKEIKAFTDIIGACERIKKTPIPFSYNLFLKKFIFAYTITLPFGLAHDFHYYTVPIATFVLYIFGSLELLAEEIEDPFGIDSNDLPTDDLAITIKRNVDEILG